MDFTTLPASDIAAMNEIIDAICASTPDPTPDYSEAQDDHWDYLVGSPEEIWG